MFRLRGDNQALQIRRVNCKSRLIIERDLFLYVEDGCLKILIHIGVFEAEV